MVDWNIDFITYDDFKKHVRKTILNYGEKLKPYDVARFNKNIIDPIKMVFDKSVYGEDWPTIIANGIFRQRDKSNNNEVGYFHQRLFEYVANCEVPPNGVKGGWDVIYTIDSGYQLDGDTTVHKIYVEMKNKHNTLNGASAGKTLIKMQNQIVKDDDCVCFLVEAIARRSQNIVWCPTVDGQKISNKRIRRVSMDKFYEIVTGDADAFYKICMVLPDVVAEVLAEAEGEAKAPFDTVYSELSKDAEQFKNVSSDRAMVFAMYMLGFSTYSGFDTLKE